MTRVLPALFLSMILLSSAGCTEHLAGEWAQFSSEKGDVSAVREGWRPNKIVLTIGKPIHIDYGDGVGVGWEEWIYPTGSIYLYRMVVQAVEVRPEGADPIDDIQRDKPWMGGRDKQLQPYQVKDGTRKIEGLYAATEDDPEP